MLERDCIERRQETDSPIVHHASGPREEEEGDLLFCLGRSRSVAEVAFFRNHLMHLFKKKDSGNQSDSLGRQRGAELRAEDIPSCSG